MPASVQIIPTAFSLASVFCWGTSDFLGGYACKRSNAFSVTTLVQASGFLLLMTVNSLAPSPLPPRASMLWAMAAGALGGTALAVFYQALASGARGLTAPVASLVGAAIPTAYGMARQGIPTATPIAGFAIAALGIWLISRPDGAPAESKGLGMAVLSGVGFAGFILCIHQVGDSSAVWSAAFSRLASCMLLAMVVVAQGPESKLVMRDAWLAALAGCLDVTGTALFIRANQTGRLDSAVVITSLYPAVTVVLARVLLREHFTRWKAAGILAALTAVPLIAWQ